jgi:hypothetical protein
MSFVRESPDGGSYIAVGLAADTAQDMVVRGVRDGWYRDAITGDELSAEHGELSFRVNPYSIGLYVWHGAGKIGDDGLYLR